VFVVPYDDEALYDGAAVPYDGVVNAEGVVVVEALLPVDASDTLAVHSCQPDTPATSVLPNTNPRMLPRKMAIRFSVVLSAVAFDSGMGIGVML